MDNLARRKKPPDGTTGESRLTSQHPQQQTRSKHPGRIHATYLTGSHGMDRFMHHRLPPTRPVKNPYASATVTSVRAIGRPPTTRRELTLSLAPSPSRPDPTNTAIRPCPPLIVATLRR